MPIIFEVAVMLTGACKLKHIVYLCSEPLLFGRQFASSSYLDIYLSNLKMIDV